MNILFVINPNYCGNYDILCFGENEDLNKIRKENEGVNRVSRWGGFLAVDICDTLRDAKACVKAWRKSYPDITCREKPKVEKIKKGGENG